MLQAIIKTLAYASIFNYTLTPKEIHHWLIGEKASFKEVQAGLKKIKLSTNFVDRKNKDKIARRKWIIAKKVAKSLIRIPSVLSILVTGNLSMNNSGIDDDIDLLIITKKNTIWTTRFLANITTDLLKVRRRPMDKTFKDKICLNMFLDEEHLKIKDQNIYTAHELLQAKPIYDKNHTYQKFISTNSWAKNYLPNAYPNINNYQTINYHQNYLFKILEPTFCFIQKQYMRSKITRETITDGQLLFHPKNTKESIIKKYSHLTKNKPAVKIAVETKE